MPRILDTLTREGFTAEILEHADGRVAFVADADIDADGANGQNGARAAYMVGNKGTEDLANGGMRMSEDGRPAFREPWGKDIAIEENGRPKVFPGGIIATKTAYRYPGLPANNPAAHVDAETVPYIVVPPSVIQKTKGAVLGCQARATNLRNGKTVNCVVADVGPRTKCGELSMAAARAIGIPDSPRHGGEDEPIVMYELWPGQPAEIHGKTFALQRSNGTYAA